MQTAQLLLPFAKQAGNNRRCVKKGSFTGCVRVHPSEHCSVPCKQAKAVDDDNSLVRVASCCCSNGIK